MGWAKYEEDNFEMWTERTRDRDCWGTYIDSQVKKPTSQYSNALQQKRRKPKKNNIIYIYEPA